MEEENAGGNPSLTVNSYYRSVNHVIKGIGALSKEELVQELISLIEDNESPWRKAAFYSDPKVGPIYEKLINAWLKAGEKGIPLDYASIEDLEVLVSIARKYAFMNENRARAIAMSRMGEDSFSSMAVRSR